MIMEIITIALIVFFCVVSISLGIINWIQFAGASSKISYLETEIEKKTKEFDALKKERQATPQQSLINEQQKSEKYSAQSVRPDNYKKTENPPIEIVRNIGNGFKNVAIDAGGSYTELTADSYYPSPAKAVLPDEADGVSTKQYVVKPIEPFYEDKINNFTLDPETPISDNQSSSDVLDIVDDRVADKNEIFIELYSTAKKDTDFPDAWKKLSDNLSKVSNPRVVLDFDNVLFLYEKELHYLKKISDVVGNVGGCIEFVNCHIELQSIISGVPGLAGHIKRL
jgi:hypothetical protein